MNKKGFTLVELLAVIVILAVLVTIAVPSAIAISNRIKTKMYCSKVKLMVEAAELYGQDHFNEVKSGAITNVSIKKLVEEDYLKRDNKDVTLGNGAMRDPRDNTNLDNKLFNLSAPTKRVEASYDDADYSNTCKNID